MTDDELKTHLRHSADVLRDILHQDMAEGCSRASQRIDALRAELAERTRERDEHAKWRMALADKLHDRETELAAERERQEAAEKDAARYRWLRGDAPTHSERWPRWNLQRWDGRCWHSLERGALDAAIDAAMKD